MANESCTGGNPSVRASHIANPQVAAAAAATDAIEAHDSADAERPRTNFQCREGAPAARAAASSLQRLSKLQLHNALRDLLSAMLPPHVVNPVWQEVSSQFAYVPADVVSKHAPFSSMDQAISQQHVEAYLQLAESAARALTASAERIASLLACEPGASPDACVNAFLQRFARRAYRKPIAGEDMHYLRAVYNARGLQQAALYDAIVAVLSSPFFLYRVEFGAAPVPGRPGTYQLSDHELAAKLALVFWQTGPDPRLLDAADRGELSTQAGYLRELDRVLADERARDGFATFVREWLYLDGLRELNTLVGDRVFDAFRGKSEVSHQLREDMIDDVVASFVFHVSEGHSYADFLASPYAFAKSDELAAIYGVSRWKPGKKPPRFPKGQRAGLLSRAALVATGSSNTRPIMKGVFVRERLLCDRLPAPPANAASGLLELSPTATTREIVEDLTERRDSSCAFCHASRINALGYATESYDALGRFRREQLLYAPDGKLVGKAPVNTASVPHIWPDDERVARGVDDLTLMIQSSGKGQKCFALQYARFVSGRAQDEGADGCILEDVREALAGGASLREAMRVLATRPEFRQRVVAAGEVQ